MDEDHPGRHFPPSPPSPFSLGCGNWNLLTHGQTGEEEGWLGEGTDKVTQALLYATLELETTRIAAQEKIHRMECEVARFRELLATVIRERDEAREQTHHALLLLDSEQSLVLFHDGGGPPMVTPRLSSNSGLTLGPQFPSLEAVEAVNNARNSCGGLARRLSPAPSSLSSEESSVVVHFPAGRPAANEPAVGDVELSDLVPQGKLPEKGKLLEAVMKAGPLLQNLMLAGPLPQWRHPPPPLRSIEIPPVSISINCTTAAAASSLPANPTLTAGTATIPSEDMKPSLDDNQGLCSNRNKRAMAGEEDGEPKTSTDPLAWSPPSSSSSQKISSDSSKTCRNGSKYLKIGPFLRC